MCLKISKNKKVVFTNNKLTCYKLLDRRAAVFATPFHKQHCFLGEQLISNRFSRELQLDEHTVIYYGIHVYLNLVDAASDFGTMKDSTNFLGEKWYTNLCVVKCEALEEDFVAVGHCNVNGTYFDSAVFMKVKLVEVLEQNLINVPAVSN